MQWRSVSGPWTQFRQQLQGNGFRGRRAGCLSLKTKNEKHDRLQLAGTTKRPTVDGVHASRGHKPADNCLHASGIAGNEDVQREPADHPGLQYTGRNGVECLHNRSLSAKQSGKMLGGRVARRDQHCVKSGSIYGVAGVDDDLPPSLVPVFNDKRFDVRIGDGQHDDRASDRGAVARTLGTRSQQMRQCLHRPIVP